MKSIKLIHEKNKLEFELKKNNEKISEYETINFEVLNELFELKEFIFKQQNNFISYTDSDIDFD